MYSIIIPVYNLEAYISQCLDSILKQDNLNFEIILVDDGSTDNTSEIINDYVVRYENIKYIYQNNSGPGAARNKGLENASFDYILFIDGDDFVTRTDIFSKLTALVNDNRNSEVDIFCFPLQRTSGINETEIVKSTVEYSQVYNSFTDFSELLNMMLREGKILSSPCEMVFKRKFLVENNLFFKENIFSEDIEWIIRIMLAQPKIFFSNYQYYCYRFNREGSTCNSEQSFDTQKNIVIFINDWYDKLKGSTDSLSINILCYIAYHWCVAASKLSDISNERMRKELLDLLLKSKGVLRYHKMEKVKIFYNASRLLGVYRTAKLSRVRYLLKRKLLF